MKTFLRNPYVWTNDHFEKKDVLIDNGVIRIGSSASHPVYDVEKNLDGLYLLPGIIDCHAHVSMVCGTRHMPDFFASSENDLVIDSVVNAERMVRNGITTIRDCGGKRFETLSVRNYINKGKILGPRILCSGTPLKAIGGHEPGMDYTGPIEARAKVREFLYRGVDFIKVMVTGGLGKAGEKPGCVEITQEELSAITEEAVRHGKKVACHCHSKEGMQMIINAGASSIEHSTFLDKEIDEQLIEKGIYVVPTFLPYMNYALYGEENNQLMDTVLAARAIVSEKKTRFREAYEMGVKIAFGRDSGGFLMDQGRFVEEMLFMEDAGMSRADIINSATRNAADLLGISDITGTIEDGKDADLVILRSNPLDDLKAFEESLDGVYARGVFVEREEDS